jgi:hypothetical protein
MARNDRQRDHHQTENNVKLMQRVVVVVVVVDNEQSMCRVGSVLLYILSYAFNIEI